MYVNASFITSGPLALSAASAPNYFRAFSRLAGEHCGIGCFLAFLFVAIMLAIEDSRGEEQSPADNFLQKQQKQQKNRDLRVASKNRRSDAGAGQSARRGKPTPRLFPPWQMCQTDRVGLY